MGSQIRTVPHRRRRENKTNYKTRLDLLKSNEHRFVVRKTLKQIIVQLVKYNPEGDKVLFTINSSQLKKMGWKHSTSNIPSAYLIGLLAGKKAQELKVKKGILDLGVSYTIKGSRLFATLKGLIDSGLEIPSADDIFPSEERISGKHIADYKKNEIDKDFNELKKKILV